MILWLCPCFHLSGILLSLGVVESLLKFEWTWVGLFDSGDIKGDSFLRELGEEMVRKGIRASCRERMSVM